MESAISFLPCVMLIKMLKWKRKKTNLPSRAHSTDITITTRWKRRPSSILTRYDNIPSFVILLLLPILRTCVPRPRITFYIYTSVVLLYKEFLKYFLLKKNNFCIFSFS